VNLDDLLSHPPAIFPRLATGWFYAGLAGGIVSCGLTFLFLGSDQYKHVTDGRAQALIIKGVCVFVSETQALVYTVALDVFFSLLALVVTMALLGVFHFRHGSGARGKR
jgi:hypothetical protein